MEKYNELLKTLPIRLDIFHYMPRKMILCALILVGILMHFEFVKCHEIFEILPSIMVEFRFNQFITIDNKLGWNDMSNVVKNLNHQGYFIGFSQKQSDKY